MYSLLFDEKEQSVTLRTKYITMSTVMSTVTSKNGYFKSPLNLLYGR
jgi:hypothetical protein